ncbi:HAMP domain-containing sensor histidine kinase [Desulfitobacterium chlororespirans]|uniref:histidine kinase n=1 Tax=Desulfitobacterium chlororespirans DSM 11544 TaxID=1121395 RepID=A0A1M7TGU2_9FIRM|nr:HAMP domain-containing sensor histidine kinase [Desulfitobacterium chlororespirans]SHN69989.1 histidine kinase [Desulfitobacterium chlororespirans DSM 11544]
MNRAKREYKLSQTLMITAVLACLASALLFLGLQYLSRGIIHDYCKKPEVISAHIEKKITSLRQYIKDNHISLSDLSELDNWMRGKELTEIVIYHDNMLIYSSHTLSPSFSFPSQPKFPDFYLWHNKYILTFQEGTAEVFIKDFFEHRYIDYITYFNLLVFFLCFITIMVFFIHKKVSYINTLEKEIRILEGGDLHYSITIKGNDELASLAQEIDEMRKAFIAREDYAERVRVATNTLMAGVSHDLRTPLTALIGYLEVLEGEDIPARESPFLRKCKNRALQIKDLINHLFDYFFISTNDYKEIDLKHYPAQEVLREMIHEHIYLMEQSGFTVSSTIELPERTIKVDPGMIQRIFDNMLSNVQRHADPAHPIRLYSTIDSGELVLVFENHGQHSLEPTPKTGLGLNNCQKIMLLHQGWFIYRQNDHVFTVQLSFPLI